MLTQREKADLFRALHRPGQPLVLVNAWDAVSARIIEDVGFPAIATTSAGIAWLEGYADGEHIPRERMLAGVARVTKAVAVPVSADCEAGYGQFAQDAVSTAQGVVAAGAVGLNFEDWDAKRDALTALEAQVSRIAAIRKAGEGAGVPLVINARTDVFLKRAGDSDAWRMEEAVRRANAYLDAGAACAFLPGVSDERTIGALTAAIHGPVNFLAGPATPTVARLSQLGVARISLGAAPMAFMLTHFREMAAGIKDRGEFQHAGKRLSHADINELFT